MCFGNGTREITSDGGLSPTDCRASVLLSIVAVLYCACRSICEEGIFIHSPFSGLCIVFVMTLIELCVGTLLILAMVRVFCVLSERVDV